MLMRRTKANPPLASLADDAPSAASEQKYLSVREMCEQTGLPNYTLRYWEQNIPELSALIERRGRKRYYRREAVEKFLRVRTLMSEGHTLRGVRTAIFSRAQKKRERAAAQSGQMARIRTAVKQAIKTLG